VIFGFRNGNQRYPDAPPVPETVLINPQHHGRSTRRKRRAGKAASRCRVCAGWCRAIHRIRYTGFDPLGAVIEREAEGFHARVVQHECDHLIGRLYPTRIRDLTQFGYTSVLFPGLDAAQRRRLM
jgi:peptide deformylase